MYETLTDRSDSRSDYNAETVHESTHMTEQEGQVLPTPIGLNQSIAIPSSVGCGTQSRPTEQLISPAIFELAKPLEELEHTQNNIVNRRSRSPSPTKSPWPEPKWVAELSLRKLSHRCPLFGVPLMDPVFGMNEGACPMRACSDHASAKGTTGEYESHGLLPIASVNIDESCSSIPPHLPSACVKKTSSTSMRRFRKPIPERSQGSNRRVRRWRALRSQCNSLFSST
ncbi:hypothetical protein BKA63DRAFT_196274 [Paraphoma chrysanthemicola]|nr:hypothetical protein BKA63DRAFT_196274 [Paraphoma chrysanthemicola]